MAKQKATSASSEVMAAIQDGLAAEFGGAPVQAAPPPVQDETPDPSDDYSEVTVDETQESQEPEQPPKQEKPKELPKDDEIDRMVQSRADKLILKERLRWEKEQQEARERDAQQQALREMSDEDYGALVRQQGQLQEVMQKATATHTGTVLMGLQEEALNLVSDEAARKAIAERAAAGEIKSFGQLMKEVNEALVAERVKSETPKITKQVRESVLKELGAVETDEGGPDLGTGAAQPVFVDWRKKPAHTLIAEGLEEDAKRSRKR